MTTVGTMLGNYLLEDLLGSSGLATVHSAVDTRSGQRVALKVLHAYFSQEEALTQRFFHELARIKALTHPNILPLLEWGREDGAIWLATEYAPEGSLRTSWLAPGPLETTLLVVEGVAAALEQALAQGLTHRNLKPSNIFWDREQGMVRLADFGMATLGEGAHPLIRTALTTPMPAFMAPEYASEGRADARSETFSLAVLTYWLLTGVVPYPAEAPSTMYAKAMRHDVTPPSGVNPAVAHEVDKVILRALAPFPAVRPSSPGALVAALRGAGLHGAAPAKGAVDDQASLVTTVPGALAPAAVPSIGALAPPFWREGVLERLWRAPGPRHLLRERLVQGALVVSLVAASALGYAAWNKPPDIPPPSSSISAEIAATQWTLPRYDLQNSGYAPVATSEIKGQIKWKFQTEAPFGASPTSDGATVYAATGDKRVVALDAETGAVRWQTPTTGPVDAAPVAAGDLVYVGLRDRRLLALDRTTGQLRWEFSSDNPIISSAVVADGVVFQGSGDGRLYALDAATGALRWSFDARAWIVAPPTVVEDMVITAGRDGWIHFLDRANGRERFLFYTAGPLYTAPAVADGHVYMATDSRRLFSVSIHERSTFLDRQIYWARVQLFLWQMAPPPPLPKGLAWVVRLPARSVSSAAVAHGVVYIGTEANKLLAYDAQTRKVVWELAAQSPVLGGPIVTEDVLYVGADDGKLYAVDPHSGEQRWVFQTGGKIRTSPAVAGGKLFVTSEDGALYALQ